MPKTASLDIYDKNSSYMDKITFILKERDDEGLSLQAIAKIISENEPERNFKDITNNLSAILSMDSKKPLPKFKRLKNGNSKYVYMLA